MHVNLPTGSQLINIHIYIYQYIYINNSGKLHGEMQVNLPKRVASPTGIAPLAVQPESGAAAASLRAEQLQRELSALKAQWSKRQAEAEAQSVDFEHRQRLLRSAAGWRAAPYVSVTTVLSK